MDAPEVEGLKIVGLIESGGCGAVYRAEDTSGNPVALKLFDESTVQRSLLRQTTLRLASGGWPEGVMPVLFSDFDSTPPTLVSPLYAEIDDDGQTVPRSLQYRLGGFPGKASWPVVRAIARALAEMHARRVAHGNLKPGNVFFSAGETILLSDWALGNMPGIFRFQFTDAVLYQSPEQLRNPEGYVKEAGYRWDVFAFGVLAFRLLTGKFPRGEETFVNVAPEPGTHRRDGIRADLESLAVFIESTPEVTWPLPPENPLQEGLREWIDRCLHLDPTQRPATMAEVVAGFAAVDQQVAAVEERDALLDQRRLANRRAARWAMVAVIASAAAVVAAGATYLKPPPPQPEDRGELMEISALKEAVLVASTEKQAAEKAADEALKTLDYEREVATARLEASRMIGDRLFAWALEKGHRRLPPLDGREQRLKTLERYFVEFLERTAEIAALEDERAQVRLELAEISLAAGDANLAIQRFEDALKAWKSLSMDADQRFRMAKNRLLLALLLQSNNDLRTEEAFTTARTELEAIPLPEVDSDRLMQLLAILDFSEAKLLSARGEEAQALEQLMTATQVLNKLSDQRPDSVVLRSELAACYLSSATILEGMGNLGDAREVQSLASSQILKLLKDYPDDPVLRFELAGCYGAMAESALLSGDIVNAESMSNEAMKLLGGLIREQPDHAEAISRMAAQIGLRAGLMRDRGETAAAMKSFEEGIRMLESVRSSSAEEALVDYRLALLWWQKGRMLGMAGKRTEEIELIRRAEAMMVKLEAAKHSGGPTMDKIQTTSAYLLGDLGHALQMAGTIEEAKEAYTESARFWERLLESQPKSEEFLESLAWCRQRLKELK